MENMSAEKQRLYGEFEEKGSQEICVSDHINGLQYTSTKSDSFVVDMERFSHIIEKDINANSRITRNLSRKGSFRSGERKTYSNAANEKDTNFTTNSPRASLLGGGISTPEKPMALAIVGTTDQPTPQTHNQITIVAGHSGATATATESKISGRRFSFRRTSSASNWSIDPRRILLFFATLSSMGTMLLIYFTLSIAKLNGEDSTLSG
ncbi:PREDICTED: uncharacterized protein LOC109216823 isoform X2 [Nicotiana attenuata]|uniref:uncharacterized protein LOC109216823 isoform X2 n=1 Tax=Nicotiana attenuata TaxID=49451 RepID=UPI000905B323|nr:PREDICTED: uncharacterized protein LOC109216823 isoform X2 [Nicotiana attenuata]